jgi:mRNA interferase RelE/StbE
MFDLDLGKPAERFLSKLPQKQQGQIWRKLFALQENPFPNDYKKLHGHPYGRVDIGEYRIVYKVLGSLVIVRIIGKRNDDEVYKRLKRLDG